MARCLITGHKGYIGSSLKQNLDQNGHETFGIDLKDGRDDAYHLTGESYDFSFDGSTFVTFSNCPEGAVLPLRVVGVRKTSGGAAPSSGDIAFLY